MLRLKFFNAFVHVFTLQKNVNGPWQEVEIQEELNPRILFIFFLTAINFPIINIYDGANITRDYSEMSCF